MTQQEIIEMAIKAGFHEYDFPFKKFKFEAFAKLVADKATDEANARSNAAWALMCKKMVADEREACAKESEDSDHVVLGRSYHDQLGDADATARNIAAAIRARGGEVLASPIIKSYLEKDNLEEDLYDLAIKADNGGQP